jgi:glycosyltransferase involved in cell wall biosynthesis
VANTSRQFDAFARRRQLPFLRVSAGPATRTVTEGEHTAVEIKRGRPALPIEKDMSFDLALPFRQYRPLKRILQDFRPDVIHVTGPSDIGILGISLSRSMGIPLVASWHTNLHEYSGRRLEKLLEFLPRPVSRAMGRAAESASLDLIAWFYRRARVGLAPNPELVESLRQWMRRDCFLMRRGIDTHLFTPERRDRPAHDGRFVIGYVGRITSEKGVRLLIDIERQLEARGVRNYLFRVIGHGGELEWLRANLKQAEFPGVIKGEALAREYANMDLFVFPSRTDTFGNVVLEAFASGVPALVTDACGPKFLIEEGVNGMVRATDEEFAAAAANFAAANFAAANFAAAPIPAMRAEARKYAMTQSWDSVFEAVYAAYRHALRPEAELHPVHALLS